MIASSKLTAKTMTFSTISSPSYSPALRPRLCACCMYTASQYMHTHTQSAETHTKRHIPTHTESTNAYQE